MTRTWPPGDGTLRPPAPRAAALYDPARAARIGRRVVRRRAKGMDAGAADPSHCTVPWVSVPSTAAPSSPARPARVDSTPGAWTSRASTSGRTTGFTRPAEPATHTVQADSGDRYVVCDGHALTARAQITDGQVLPALPGLRPARLNTEGAHSG